MNRPVIRYHGGKYLLAPWIISYFPEHRGYTETFGGGGSVLMQKWCSYAETYNDLDGEIVNLFRVLRDPSQARELERILNLTPYSRSEFEAAYYPAPDPIEAARRLLIRSFMGIGCSAVTGNERSNRGRPATGFRAIPEPNGALRAKSWAEFPNVIPEFSKRLKGVVIENMPAHEVLMRFDTTETLHYVDPPYPKSTRDKGDDYRYEMTDSDHRDLAETLHGLKGMVVLSGYHCDLYDKELYPDWQQVSRVAVADQGQSRTEVLWFNPACCDRRTKASQMNIFEFTS